MIGRQEGLLSACKHSEELVFEEIELLALITLICRNGFDSRIMLYRQAYADGTAGNSQLQKRQLQVPVTEPV